MDVRDVLADVFQVGPLPGVLIEMPKPLKMPEAHFVAILLVAELNRESTTSPKIAYYTLEKSSVPGGPDFTMLGRWSGDGVHSNLGCGPPPEKEAFLSAVTELGKKLLTHETVLD